MFFARTLAVPCLAGLVSAQQWLTLPATAHPPITAHVAMAFDPVRHRAVCCACEDISTTAPLGRTTTWEWDGARWLRRAHTTVLSPLPAPIAMTWDSARQKVVLTNSNSEIWSFDGEDWQLEGPGNNAFNDPSLAFDSTRGVLVCADFGQLYEEQNGAWVLRAATAAMSNGTRIAFDAPSNRVIAFGGYDPSIVYSDTWSWDGTTVRHLSPATIPPARAEHSLTVDPVSGRPLLIGGIDFYTHQRFADVYAWNGANWVAQPPLPRPQASAAAAPFGNDVLVFGGQLGSSTLTWEQSHELVRRTAGTFATVPMPAPGAVTAFDPVRQRTISVGASTYESDGFTWIDTGIVPPFGLIALAGHLAAWSIVGIDTVGTTWLYDGVSWSAPALATHPSMRQRTALALDPIRNRVVLFGGQFGFTVFNDVWEWDGTGWTHPFPPTSPPAGAAMFAWDHPNQRLVLVPQFMTSTSSTYTWDGTAWNPIGPTPIGQTGVALAGHAAGPVLLSTSGQPYTLGVLAWLLAGNTWLPLANGPDLLVSGSLVFDENRGEVVMHDALQRRSLIFSPLPADSLASGAGCAGSNGVPRLVAASLPQLGAPVRSDLLRAAPSSVAFLLADLAGANVPLPGGCTQLVANPIVLATMPTNTAGFASAKWTIPADPAVRGIVVYEQVLTLDPNGALFGFASLTGALQLRVGD